MEPAAAPVTAVMGALKPVVAKLATLMGEKHKGLKGVHVEIKLLADELSAMDTVLLNMTGEENEDPADVQDKAWMNEVRELSYNMEDSIDDFIMQTIVSGDKDINKPDHGFVEKMKDSMGKMEGRRQAGKGFKEEIIGFLEKVKDMSRAMKAHCQVGDDVKEEIVEVVHAAVDPSALAMFELLSNRDEPKAELIKLLTQDEDEGCELLLVELVDGCEGPLAEVDEGSELLQSPAAVEDDGCDSPLAEEDDGGDLPLAEEDGGSDSPLAEEDDGGDSPLAEEDDGCPSQTRKQPKVVTIVGAGGTVLANQVYEELRVKFDYWPFISLSPNPELAGVLTMLRLELTGQYKETGSVQQLIDEIKDFLLDKSYLIVVDGIWEKETWDVIKHAFPMTSCGGVIITTTQCEDVADSCRSSFNGHIYHVRPLDKMHSRKLFHQRLFNSEDNCHPDIEVSDQILEKCDGLPLAILVVSGLLANTERTEHLWNRVKDSIEHALETSDSVERMMKVLSVCYSDLHPRVKSCFLYLSIFPKGSTIKMNDLIRRWSAEGFFHGEGRYTVHELGERCFNELLNRSLIQPMKIDEYGKVKSCQVHDTVMDSIISKSTEENFVTLVGGPGPTIDQTRHEVRRLSLQDIDESNSIQELSLVSSHARSLIVFGQLWEISSLDEFKHLRVVDFGGCKYLQSDHLENIGRLFQLRYLNLSGSGICEVPEQIGHLCSLEMLDLRGTCVTELPSTIVNLGKLVHLFVSEYVKFPNGGIKKMQSVETLKQVKAFKQPIIFLQEFGQLQNLRKMNMNFEDYQEATEDTKECMKAITSSLCELGTHNLSSLTIWNCSWSLLMEQWCPAPLGLQRLKTWRSTFLRVPDWMGSLSNLQLLRFDVERVRYEDLCILGGLPALLNLTLVGKEMSEGKIIVSGEMGFPCLSNFCYSMWRGLGIDMVFEAGSMPKLEKLKICFSPTMNEYLFSTGGISGAGPFAFGIENLSSSLTIVVCECESFNEDHSLEATKAALERAVSTHPSCPNLDFVIY
ncbi:hypothetical protein ACQ4PT_031363 [Festuca glaucescens]